MYVTVWTYFYLYRNNVTLSNRNNLINYIQLLILKLKLFKILNRFFTFEVELMIFKWLCRQSGKNWEQSQELLKNILATLPLLDWHILQTCWQPSLPTLKYVCDM